MGKQPKRTACNLDERESTSALPLLRFRGSGRRTRSATCRKSSRGALQFSQKRFKLLHLTISVSLTLFVDLYYLSLSFINFFFFYSTFLSLSLYSYTGPRSWNLLTSLLMHGLQDVDSLGIFTKLLSIILCMCVCMRI